MKKFIVMLLALAMVLPLVACGGNGSQYVEGTFACIGTNSTMDATDRDYEKAKKNSPEKIYFNKNGKFEAFWLEGDSDSLTGKYELQKYEPGTISFRDNQEEDAAETGRITLCFDNQAFGNYTYEYVYDINHYNGDEELYLYIDNYAAFWDTYHACCRYEKQ